MPSIGKPIKNHPVVEQLARLRVLLDKIKPVDKKLKYQVDKLLKLGARTNFEPHDEEGGHIDDEDEDMEANPLRFKPNPTALVALTMPLIQILDLPNLLITLISHLIKAAASAIKESATSDDGVYRISRVNQKLYDDDHEAKRDKKAEKLKARVANSKLIQQMRADLYTDKPERVEVFGDHLIKGNFFEHTYPSFCFVPFRSVVDSRHH